VHAATFEAHAEIIRALRARDRIAYVYLMSRHLEFGIRFVDAVPGSSQPR
jgi:GntR family transcriptional repressor for pyruvate dehydrogenase complex